MQRLSRRRTALALAAAAFSASFLLLALFSADEQSLQLRPTTDNGETRSSIRPGYRKLLEHADETNRIGERCSKDDIRVHQGATAPLPSGIPTYTVEILNVCVTGCSISRIHLSCGWFSSARMINPSVFKRLRYNDCLVNNGKPLPSGATLSFQYANTFRYPLSVSSITC